MDIFRIIALVLGMGMTLFALLAWAYRLLSGNPIQTLNAKPKEPEQEPDEEENIEDKATDDTIKEENDGKKDKE